MTKNKREDAIKNTANMALIFVIFSILYMFYSGFIDKFFLGTIDKIYLVSYESSLVIFCVFGLSLPYIFCSKFQKNKNYQIFLRSLAFLFTYIFIVFSWGHRYFLGSFLHVSSIEMFISSPGQMLVHAKSIFGWGFLKILILAIFGCIILLIFYRLLSRLAKKFIISLILIPLICLGITGNIINIESKEKSYVQTESGIENEAGLFREVKSSQLGPVATIVENLLARDFSTPDYVIGNDRLIKRNMKRALNQDDKKKKSVIIILIESFRFDTFGQLEKDVGGVVMPGLKKELNNATVFSNAIGQSTHSNYADVVPFSSQYPLREGRLHLYPKNAEYDRTKIYDVLHDLNYATAIISSQNEYWLNMSNFLKSEKLDLYAHSGNIKRMAGFISNNEDQFYASVDSEGNNFTNQDKIKDKVTLALAKQWIESVYKEKPFFLYMNLQSTHLPFFIEENKKYKFVKDREELDEYYEKIEKSMSDKQITKRVYAEALNDIDNALTGFFDYLKSIGEWENTVIVLSGDTGIEFNGNVLGNAGAINEEVVHLPLMFIHSDLGRGIDSRLIQQVDIMPTILGTLGVTGYQGGQGVDMSNREQCNNYAFSVSHTPIAQQYAVVSNDMILIYDKAAQSTVWKWRDGEMMGNKPSEKKLEEMKNTLSDWIVTQISFYADKKYYEKYYPPKFPINKYCKVDD